VYAGWYVRLIPALCLSRESPKEKDHLKDQGVDGRMGSKWTLGRLVGGGGGGVDSPCAGWEPLAGSCECRDEPSGSGATELVH
jgi:hypothetical protein